MLESIHGTAHQFGMKKGAQFICRVLFFHSNVGKYDRKDGKPSYKLVKKPSGEWAVETRGGGHVAWDEKKA